MIIDPLKQPQKENYKLMTGTIIPRPIALISTISEAGITNLAPFSFFTGVASNPPTICFAPSRTGDGSVKKHTLQNIEATQEFVVNLTTEEMVKDVHECGNTYPSDISEFDETNFTPTPSEIVQPPRVLESPVSLECKMVQIIPVGKEEIGGGFLVIGEILLFHVVDEIIENNRTNLQKYRPLARIAGPTYTGLGEIISVK